MHVASLRSRLTPEPRFEHVAPMVTRVAVFGSTYPLVHDQLRWWLHDRLEGR